MVASLKQARRRPAAAAKSRPKPNASILNFFRPADKEEDSLFISSALERHNGDERDDNGFNDTRITGNRFNESDAPVKKRRLSIHDEASQTAPVQRRRPGLPFIMDSDSDAEEEQEEETNAQENGEQNESSASVRAAALADEDEVVQQHDDHGEEACLMRLFAAEEADAISDGNAPDTAIDACPICGHTLAGLSPHDASRHVNLCLDDAGCQSLSSPAQEAEALGGGDGVGDGGDDGGNDYDYDDDDDDDDGGAPHQDSHQHVSSLSKRLSRAAMPRPAQPNPLPPDDSSNPAAKSAFSTLMSANAEDSAWATAAAAEHASRGRPAYQRTCPFYKMLPGFNICVDAFRYGAVEGCRAYFLSHFHSDHYMGLSASWCHGPIYCSTVTGRLVKQQLKTAAKWVVELDFDKLYPVPGTDASVTMIAANHCPGSSLFLFEKGLMTASGHGVQRVLHCGDFRACPAHVSHPLLKPDVVDAVSGRIKQQSIHVCYLDTTYLNPRYSFPPQEHVIEACAHLCASMSPDPDCKKHLLGPSATAARHQPVSKFFHACKTEAADYSAKKPSKPRQRLLVVCGTYSIGKERICVAIAKALASKIYVNPGKAKIFRQLQDDELTSLLTSNPLEAQVHMQSLMEIRAETLQDYLTSYKPHFSRIVGFRPSGWTFRPAHGKTVGANTPPGIIPTQDILHGKAWRTTFDYNDLTPQRGSTNEAMCFGVPYSEHSSFRELAIFIMSLRIEKVIPTVNVGSEQSRRRMKAWIDRWMADRRRGGLVMPLVHDNGKDEDLWQGDPTRGRGVWW